jgi:hypothetical protein
MKKQKDSSFFVLKQASNSQQPRDEEHPLKSGLNYGKADGGTRGGQTWGPAARHVTHRIGKCFGRKPGSLSP